MFSFIQKMDRKQRRLLYTCFFAFFSNGALSLTLGSVMPDLKTAYALSDTVSGLFLSAHSAGNLVAGFLSALIPLYLGERKSIMLMSALAFLGFLMMTLWGNPVWLLLAFAMTGLGRGSVTNFDNRMVNRLSGGNPAASNMLHGSFAIGAIAAPLAFLGLRNLLGWRLGLGFVILCGVLSSCNFSRMRLENDRPDRRDKANSTLVFLKNPSFLILAMMMFCYLCSEYAINGWLVTYIQNKESLLTTIPQPPISSQPVPLHIRHPLPRHWTQPISTSADGSVKGKKLGRKRTSKSSPNIRETKSLNAPFISPKVMPLSTTRPST